MRSLSVARDGVFVWPRRAFARAAGMAAGRHVKPVPVSVKRLAHGRDLPLPSYETAHAAGMDLPAAVEADMVLKPGERALVPTGVSIALPDGFEAQIRPRSGLAARNGVTVLNSPGTVDADYRGEVKVILANLGLEPFTVTRGMRIAQMVVAPVARATLQEVDTLPESARGEGGFGSTGTGAKKRGGTIEKPSSRPSG